MILKNVQGALEGTLSFILSMGVDLNYPISKGLKIIHVQHKNNKTLENKKLFKS